MRKLILADIHGNLEALKTVLNNETFDELIVLGDIIGYGPQPNECISEIKKYNPKVIKGNHEEVLTNDDLKKYFNKEAKISSEYTRTVLSKENLEYILSLEYDYQDEYAYYVHGGPYHPEKFPYLIPLLKDSADIKLGFYKIDRLGLRLCFNSHTHIPGYFYKNKDAIDFKSFIKNEILSLDYDSTYIVNVGSIGQARNGIPKAQYVIFDTDKSTIEFKLLSYDIDVTRDEFIKQDLPSELYKRLYKGI